MKIGFAITTTPKRYDPERDYFELCPKDSVCYLHNDVKGLGMATSKNRCIKFLYDAGCDYMILMDDDTKILRPDFGRFLVDVHKETGLHHLTYPGVGAKTVLSKKYLTTTINQSDKGSGVMLFVTREVVEKVGFLNVNYPSIWGHAHIGWSIRILKSGLMPGYKNWRLWPEGIRDYFYSEDVDGNNEVQNFSKAQKDKAMKLNLKEFNRERIGRLYYEYQERYDMVH